jgi:hypothetical protein
MYIVVVSFNLLVEETVVPGENLSHIHAHPVHQNSVDIFGPRYMYVGDDFF